METEMQQRKYYIMKNQANGEDAGYAMAAADSITRIFYRING